MKESSKSTLGVVIKIVITLLTALAGALGLSSCMH